MVGHRADRRGLRLQTQLRPQGTPVTPLHPPSHPLSNPFHIILYTYILFYTSRSISIYNITLIIHPFQWPYLTNSQACKLGLPPLALGEAVSALNYTRYGVVEVAERETHDMFYTMRLYMMALPRARLFAAFLGVQGSGE